MSEEKMFFGFLQQYIEEGNVPDYSGEYPNPYELTIEDAELILNAKERLEKENKRLNNIINEIEKEIDRLLERQYESERFAKEQGFNTYLPAKENLLCVKNKLQELKSGGKE